MDPRNLLRPRIVVKSDGAIGHSVLAVRAGHTASGLAVIRYEFWGPASRLLGPGPNSRDG
ncbi:hypothetical protein GCM10027569_35800 [Flindersiella endophytica]